MKYFFSPRRCLAFSFQRMATLRNERKLVAVAKEAQEEDPRNG